MIILSLLSDDKSRTSNYKAKPHDKDVTQTKHTAASTITPMSGGLLSTISGTIEAVVKYRQYRKTITELSSLSTKELSDIGLSLSAIKSVARETIYGTVIT